jgi:hypothetical protein
MMQNTFNQGEKKVKKILITAVILVLLMTSIMAIPMQADDGNTVTGRVSVPEGDGYPYFTGVVSLNSNGSIEGNMQWKVFDFCSHGVRFCSNPISSLSFPDDVTATFTGTFTCCDLPISLYCSEGVSCDLTIIVTEATDSADYNPARLLAVLPIDVELPLGFDYGMGQGTMLVYNADGVLIASQEGDYQVDVFER